MNYLSHLEDLKTQGVAGKNFDMDDNVNFDVSVTKSSTFKSKDMLAAFRI